MKRKDQQFVERVWKHYRSKGRYDLPWRQTSHLKPYNILLSEIMLQQTQVSRVVPKYLEFVKRWPTAKQLAGSSLGEVLTAWQGLGYNRRAKALHECAGIITNERAGRFPKSYEELLALPGIGPYTAGAIMAFAYNESVPIIETNIRTVYLDYFFKKHTNVSDKEILDLVEETIDRTNPREWYWALMDYGAYLKQEGVQLNQKAKSYNKQSKFAGSDRQIRGAIIRHLAQKSQLTLRKIQSDLDSFETERVSEQVHSLLEEGLLKKTRQQYHLP